MNACTGDNSWKKLILMLMKTFDVGTIKAMGLLNCVVCDTATDINMEKLNCAEDCCIQWMTYKNLDLWFDSWDVFVVEYGFITINSNNELHFDEKMKKHMLNMDKTCLLLNGSNGNRGGHPTVTYYDICFPQLGKAMSKLALTTMMISRSTSAGELLPPHFQFQTSTQTVEAKAIQIKTIRYMLNVGGTFGHEVKQSFSILLCLNIKGGVDNEKFFEYLRRSIVKLYPDAPPVKGLWVIIKCDSSPGHLNPNLLAFLRFHGFMLYPGIPNTTTITQETDQSYGQFQSAI